MNRAEAIKTMQTERLCAYQLGRSQTVEAIDMAIEALHTEVVRCRDCKHRRPVMHTSYGVCIFSACQVKSDDFCSNGEVVTEEVQQTLL